MALDRIEAKNRARLSRQLQQLDAAHNRLRARLQAMQPGERPFALHVHVEAPKDAGDAPHVRVHEY